MVKKPYRLHNENRLVPVKVMINGEYTEDNEWDETLWIERGEDWYALANSFYENKRIRIVDRELFLRSEIINE